MKAFTITGWMAGLVLLASVDALAAETVAEFRGSSSRLTPEFEVEGPWLLEWRVTTDGDYRVAVDISLEQSRTGIHEGSVLKTQWPGNGAKLFQDSGRFQFRVNSSFAGWQLRVEQLTEEEAAAYTPRRPGIEGG